SGATDRGGCRDGEVAPEPAECVQARLKTLAPPAPPLMALQAPNFYPLVRCRGRRAPATPRVRGALRTLLLCAAVAVASCAAGTNDRAAPHDRPGDADNTSLATLRARQIARDVEAIMDGMRQARLKRLASLGRSKS